MHTADELELADASTGAFLEEARALVTTYGDWVSSHSGYRDALARQGFDAEVAGLPGDYQPPTGRLFLALVNSQPAGVVGLRTLEPGIGEVKRLFVAPGYRGMSIGQRLLGEVVDAACALGLRSLRLDTLPFMGSAQRVYRALGFVERSCYLDDPLPGARFFELALPAPSPAPELVTFHPGCEAAFEALNREWLEEFFHVEPQDELVFRDPHRAIVEGGGEIFFVRERGQLVGTCAVVHHGEGTYELANMAVAPHARGQGYGDWLVRTAVAMVRRRGGTRLYLLSDEVLADALRLYERAGFRRVPRSGDAGYARGNVMMEFPL